jgi:hypothetical protein|tara:strand:+ start:1494 stop:2075 length:582 start_codon:yes stop_codon:yes gene_type:complete
MSQRYGREFNLGDKMIITATREEYYLPHQEHLPPNTKMVCSKTEAKKIHYHYSDAYDYLIQYWEDHWHMSKYSDPSTLLNSNLHWSPIKKKTKKSKGQKIKVSSKEIRRLTHHIDARETEGKYYTHLQIFKMMSDKILQPMQHDLKILQDVTEPMYRRFNAYISWVIEFDEKYNNSQCVPVLNQCKVSVKWLK